jgi:sigma-E factor negative regulatory protein RseC
MRQRAVVIRTEGKIAEIEVSRSSMCDGCQKNGGCEHHCELSGLIVGSGKKMKTTAQNKIGAKAGDIVEVETESTKVLGYAALVFLMPIVLSAVFYFLAEAVFASGTAGVIAAAAGFVLSFAGISAVERSKKKSLPDIVIADIVERPENNGI